ncbi:hypothetical protein CIPAW_06G128500 [Carya illinoinensis]|uniref:No apical meristem-associated C-terminal domain-containing protein n=1 Tax=Carya illinoinensis TaxID=32201 RepID=A0A8T1QAZ3_CARIL|nr:hypothetical protein CIPAW_06G128500 [Carya illinoinensis]
MNTLIDEDPFFTTLLESGEGGISNPTVDVAFVDVQATQPQREKRASKHKSQWGVSFTIKEDTLLISAWLNQKTICTIFDQSVVNIQKCVNKFCGSLAQVEGMHPSGVTELDKVKILYRETQKTNFTLDHCWNLLRNQLKWQTHMESVRRRDNVSRSGSTLNSIQLEDPMENVPMECERPLGKKSEKEIEKKRKKNCNSELFAIKKKKVKMEIKAQEERSIILAEKKRKNDMKIMKLDIGSMNSLQQEYFHNLQMEIIEEQRNKAISRT